MRGSPDKGFARVSHWIALREQCCVASFKNTYISIMGFALIAKRGWGLPLVYQSLFIDYKFNWNNFLFVLLSENKALKWYDF